MFQESASYFSVTHLFDAYLQPWPADLPLPTADQLQAMKSKGMQLMSEVKAIEGECIIQLRHLGDEGRAIVDYLRLQARKIDLVLQHLMEQEARDGERYPGVQFGGSGIRLHSDKVWPRGSQLQLMLFIREEILSVMCIATVADCRENPQQAGQYLLDLEYSVISDADVEQLVKASLVIQQKQLKQRKSARE